VCSKRRRYQVWTGSAAGHPCRCPDFLMMASWFYYRICQEYITGWWF
jgi:hypothetical protein